MEMHNREPEREEQQEQAAINDASPPSFGRNRKVLISDNCLEIQSRNDQVSGYSFSRFEPADSYIIANAHEPKFAQPPSSKKIIPTSSAIITSSHIIEQPVENLPGVPEEAPEEKPAIPSQTTFSYTFEYKAITQEVLMETFRQLAIQNQMEVSKAEENKVTAKSIIPIYRKILKTCLPSKLLDPEVYQLKISERVPKKVKLVLLAGDQKNFQPFWEKFAHKLWRNGSLKCTIIEDIKHYLYSNKPQMKKLLQDLQKISDYEEKLGKVISCQKNLWKTYQSRNANEENLTPVVERLFMNQFYSEIEVSKKIGVSSLGVKEIGDLEKKKMIIKGSMDLKDILQYLELFEELGHSLGSIKAHDFDKVYPKSVECLDSLKLQDHPCPYHWCQTLNIFEHNLREETREYNQRSVKDLHFAPKLIEKLCILGLLLCKNRQIWGIIRTSSLLNKISSEYPPNNCERAMKFLQEQWQL